MNTITIKTSAELLQRTSKCSNPYTLLAMHVYIQTNDFFPLEPNSINKTPKKRFGHNSGKMKGGSSSFPGGIVIKKTVQIIILSKYHSQKNDYTEREYFALQCYFVKVTRSLF